METVNGNKKPRYLLLCNKEDSKAYNKRKINSISKNEAIVRAYNAYTLKD
jgi:hypothetical protein